MATHRGLTMETSWKRTKARVRSHILDYGPHAPYWPLTSTGGSTSRSGSPGGSGQPQR